MSTPEQKFVGPVVSKTGDRDLLKGEIGACSDAECQERVQRLRRQYQRASQAMASAAHDLNTPLAIISGYIDLLKTQKAGPITARQQAVLADMETSAVRLKRLVQDFLVFSSMESGTLAMRFETGDFKACVAEICSFWLSRFQEREVAFYQLISPEIPAFEFDYHRVQRVISNLLENAVRYANRGGSVWVAAEPIFWERRTQTLNVREERRHREKTVDANAVRVSVSDTGPGVPAEFQQQIFDDFFKVDPEGEGVGLGLSIVRRIVQGHSGRAWVESQPGHGSKFCFTLPFSPLANLLQGRPAGGPP
jgi:NtrC-family two-component system sensor histidine kinase KinB